MDWTGVQTGLAFDRTGNLYIVDFSNAMIKEWTAANNDVIALVTNGLIEPLAVAVDVAGNVYFVDPFQGEIGKWNVANGTATILASHSSYPLYLESPQSVAVDGSGNVYATSLADADILVKWTATTGSLSEPIYAYGSGVAVDQIGGVYVSSEESVIYIFHRHSLTQRPNWKVRLREATLYQRCSHLLKTCCHHFAHDGRDMADDNRCN